MKLLALMIALFFAAPAAAKDVCLTDADGRDYRFEKLKLPKKAGKMTTVLGAVRTAPQMVDAFSWGPFHGSAMTLLGSPDTAVVSIFAQTGNGWVSMRMLLDRSFQGSVSVNSDGDAQFETESLAVTPTNFGDPVSATHEWAVNGNYREWEAAADGAWGSMVALRGDRIERVPIAAAAAHAKRVDPRGDQVAVARAVRTVFGDE